MNTKRSYGTKIHVIIGFSTKDLSLAGQGIFLCNDILIKLLIDFMSHQEIVTEFMIWHYHSLLNN